MDIMLEKAHNLGISDAEWLSYLGILEGEVDYASRSKEARGELARTEQSYVARPGDRYVHPDPVYVSVAKPAVTQERINHWLSDPEE